MKQKYMDQDFDEERDLRMKLLGAKEVKGFDMQNYKDKKGDKIVS
jgi:hypothetical protein